MHNRPLHSVFQYGKAPGQISDYPYSDIRGGRVLRALSQNVLGRSSDPSIPHLARGLVCLSLLTRSQVSGQDNMKSS